MANKLGGATNGTYDKKWQVIASNGSNIKLVSITPVEESKSFSDDITVGGYNNQLDEIARTVVGNTNVRSISSDDIRFNLLTNAVEAQTNIINNGKRLKEYFDSNETVLNYMTWQSGWWMTVSCEDVDVRDRDGIKQMPYMESADDLLSSGPSLSHSVFAVATITK